MALLSVSLLSGCSATARLYPVQGPLSAQTPAPILSAKVTGFVNAGNISLVMNDGKEISGRWTRVVSGKAPVTATTNVPPADSMRSAWDTIYGSGYYVAHVLGTRLYAQAVLTGEAGRVFNVEFYKPDSPEGHGAVYGVARDSAGNLYKMVFNP